MDKRLEFTVDYAGMQIFEEFNGDKIKYPLILSIPHSGSYFPPEFLQNVRFDETTLRRNEDLFVNELVGGAIENGITAINMKIARAFVDLNRDKRELDAAMFYNYPEEHDVRLDKHSRVGLGVIHRINYKRENIYPGLLDYNEVQLRLKNVYDVYHKRLRELVNKCVGKFGFCLILDCHSMPSKICSIIDNRSGIDFCIGNLFSQSCPRDMSDALASCFWNKNYNVEFNCPYSGAFITFNYCQPRDNVYTLQLEINRSLYADENLLQKKDNFDVIKNDVSEAVMTFAEEIKR